MKKFISEILICAKCGREEELCQSVIIEGIKQPRICRDCLMKQLETGDESIDNNFYIKQLIQSGEFDSIEKLAKSFQIKINNN